MSSESYRPFGAKDHQNKALSYRYSDLPLFLFNFNVGLKSPSKRVVVE